MPPFFAVIFLLTFLFSCLVLHSNAANYADETDGTFTIPSSGRTMTKMVDVSGTLTVSGTKDATPLHILTAFVGTKHFSVGNNKILKLFYLKLTG